MKFVEVTKALVCDALIGYGQGKCSVIWDDDGKIGVLCATH